MAGIAIAGKYPNLKWQAIAPGPSAVDNPGGAAGLCEFYTAAAASLSKAYGPMEIFAA